MIDVDVVFWNRRSDGKNLLPQRKSVLSGSFRKERQSLSGLFQRGAESQSTVSPPSGSPSGFPRRPGGGACETQEADSPPDDFFLFVFFLPPPILASLAAEVM